MRLLIVQYAGDYREAFERFAEGKGETYSLSQKGEVRILTWKA